MANKSTSAALSLPALAFCGRPNAELSEESRQCGGQVVGIQAAGVGKNPSVAASEQRLLQADAGVFNSGDDAVRVNAEKGDDGRAPASDFGSGACRRREVHHR